MTRSGSNRSRIAGLLAAVLAAGSVTAGLAAQAAGGGDSSITQVTRTELHVMTFNLRYASDTPPNSWPERRPVVKRLLRQERPQIIGTQEGLYQQLRDIQSDLPSYYDSIGEGGSRGEAMHDRPSARPAARLEPVQSG